jgi:hypothetical protein
MSLGEPELSEIFNQAMTNFSELAVAAVTAAYNFTGYRTIVDVAGGHGWLLGDPVGVHPTRQMCRRRGAHLDVPRVTITLLSWGFCAGWH